MKNLIDTINEASKNHIYSAGIIIYRERKDSDDIEFFVCSPGGPYWRYRESWNFPKGQMDGDEKPEETALREFEEETGTKINKPETLYLEGLIKQNPSKSVYTYSKKWDNEDLTNCHSNTFTGDDGKEYPEIGKYAWKTLEEIIRDKGVKAYYPVFESIVNRLKTK